MHLGISWREFDPVELFVFPAKILVESKPSFWSPYKKNAKLNDLRSPLAQA